MSSEVIEIAKATQEVAKASATAIDATKQLGGFVAGVIGESVSATIGILNDKLKFIRWERQLRLYDKWRSIIELRGISDARRIIPPKLALPIIENAVLEENDELQDLWAELLASAMDPNFEGEIRIAFIDIIKQLEVSDANILHRAYFEFRKNTELKAKLAHAMPGDTWFSPTEYELNGSGLRSQLNIPKQAFETSIDNLFRLRCLAPFLSSEEFDGVRNGVPHKNRISIQHNYEPLCITALGIAFVEACMKNKA